MIFEIDDEKAISVDKFWELHMPFKAAEECSELIQAISKYELWPDDYAEEKVKKEMADVLISVATLCKRYRIDPLTINELINEKLDRRYE